MQLELFFKVGYICLHNSQRGREEQDCTQFAVLLLCHDSTGCDEMVLSFCRRGRHNDRHCEGDLRKDCS